MLKKSSRFLSVLIAVVVLMGTVLPGISYAETESIAEDTNVVIDNSKERVAQVTENGVTTKATLNKESNTLTIKEEGKEPLVLNLGEITKEHITDGDIKIPTDFSKDFSTMGIFTPKTKQDTFINYEYTITHSSPEKWQLRRPKGDSLFNYYYKNTTRTSSNKTNLDLYQNHVEKINALELAAIGSAITTVGLSWLAFILSVPTAGAGTLTAGLGALGAYGATLTSLIALHSYVNKARTVYFRI